MPASVINTAKAMTTLHSRDVLEVNDLVLLAPGTIAANPLGTWLVELAGVDRAELKRLLFGERAARPWFEQSLARLRAEGVVAP